MVPLSAGSVLAGLVEHRESVDHHLPLAEVQRAFARCGRRFLAIVDGPRFVGLADARQIALRLSAQFGLALFGKSPVREHAMDRAMVIAPDAPITAVLETASARGDVEFFDDIVLAEADGTFLGLIPMHRLVRLQTSLLMDNIAALEESRRVIAARHREMEDELRMAREVQVALLPSAGASVECGDVVARSAHACLPAGIIGGDLLAYARPDAGSLGLLVCDVMGHGVRSALITAIVRALVGELHGQAGDPGFVLTALNRGLQGILRGAGEVIFVTAVYVVIDLARRELRFAQAGHPTPLLRRAVDGEAAPLAVPSDVAGPALGLIDDWEFAGTRLAVEPGDCLLLFTDGVIEAAAGDGEEFGLPRLCGAFAAAAAVDRPVDDVVDEVIRAARAFSAHGSFADDVCVVAARLAPAADPGGARKGRTGREPAAHGA